VNVCAEEHHAACPEISFKIQLRDPCVLSLPLYQKSLMARAHPDTNNALRSAPCLSASAKLCDALAEGQRLLSFSRLSYETGKVFLRGSRIDADVPQSLCPRAARPRREAIEFLRLSHDHPVSDVGDTVQRISFLSAFLPASSVIP
jgi:hypothetical protein